MLKIKKISINKMIVALLALLNINIFYFVYPSGELAKIWGSYHKTLLVIIALFSVLFTNFFIGKIKFHSKFLKQYLLVSTIVLAVICMYSIFAYPGQSMLYIFYTMSHFLFIWYATVLLREFLIDGGIEATLNVINVITFVLYVLLFIQFFIYATTGTVIFPREFGLRSNSIRIPLSAFGNLMIIYNYWKFRFSKNYSAFNIIQLALGIFLLFFVQQTRAYYIVVLGSILVMELVGKKTKYYVVKNLLIVLCLIAFIGFSSVWENFVDSLSVENETYGVATGARLLAIDYYWDAFLDNPLFAQGFIADVRYTNIMQGPFGIYNYSDVGFIGLLAQTGLFSIVLFIWPVVRWIKIIIRCKRNNIDYSLLLGLLFFSLSSMVSLSLFDSPRAILLPFLLAIFEFYYVQSINKIGDTKIGGVRRIERKI